MSLVKTDFEKKDVVSLVLNRSEKLNAFSHELMADFESAFSLVKKKCASGEIQILVLKSASPKAFCGGADLSERAKMSEAQVSETLLRQRKIVDAVEALPIPTLALIDGIAFGLGLELALACDLRIAAPTAKLGLPETRLAIIPGAGGTQRLSRLVGPAKAKELIFRGAKISGDEAFRIGLVNAISDPSEKLAEKWIEEILLAGPLALVAAKAAIDGGSELKLNEGLDWERKCYQKVLQSKDRLEGLKAFGEKRAPQYQGQ